MKFIEINEHLVFDFWFLNILEKNQVYVVIWNWERKSFISSNMQYINAFIRYVYSYTLQLISSVFFFFLFFNYKVEL